MTTVVVTGANRGIGLELCRLFAGRGDRVVGVCRSGSDELAELGVEVVEGVDVTRPEGIRRLSEELGERRVDVLVNNAGLLTRESLDDLDLDRIRRQMEVNAYGPLRVTAALRDRLGDGSKVVIVTSRMGSIDDNTSGGRYGYRMSKAAVNMAGRSLAHDLAEDGVSVMLVHPGFVRTGMTGGQGDVDPDESAANILARIDELGPDRSGTFWHAKGEPLPW